MEVFEINTKNKALRMLHKILLVTGIITLLYLVIQLFDEYLKSKKQSSFGN